MGEAVQMAKADGLFLLSPAPRRRTGAAGGMPLTEPVRLGQPTVNLRMDGRVLLVVGHLLEGRTAGL